MNIIKPSATIVDLSKLSHLAMMEMAGRICYRSEDKIDENSAVPFVREVIKKGHWSVTEFAVFTFRIGAADLENSQFLNKQLPYLTIDSLGFYQEHQLYSLLVTGTARGFREAYQQFQGNVILNQIIAMLRKNDNVSPMFEDLCEPYVLNAFPPDIEQLSLEQISHLSAELRLRHTWAMVHYIVNRAVSHELVRHRPCSWLQESQRYCRYSQDKFGNQVTFIDPRGAFPYFEDDIAFKDWAETMRLCEVRYLDALAAKASPQAARTMLPNSCKTELVQLCNLTEWKHFFKLRTSSAAEPSMREVTIPLFEQFKAQFPDIFTE